MSQVVILHGWSDTSKSFENLANFLLANGHAPVSIWLGDYISLDDDVSVKDVAKRLHAVLADLVGGGKLGPSFDMIVHSTGALVTREWLATYYGTDSGQAPVKRLIMLAPANFGSRLASLGQSFLGRVFKGWKNWFHTGKTMLRELELASPYQWDLALRDWFVPPGTAAAAPALYGPAGVWPFVITGSHPYTDTLRQIVNEDGADGTIRVAAANLNAKGITIDFSRDEENPDHVEWAPRSAEPVPFAVLADRTHSSITDPDATDVRADATTHGLLGRCILDALACDSIDTYRALFARWDAISDATRVLADDDEKRRQVFLDGDSANHFHQFYQVLTRVVDDHGDLVGDYFLEFFGPEEDKSDDSSVYFHRDVLKDVHTNDASAAFRCLYADRNNLVGHFYSEIRGNKPKVLNMSVSATPPGDNVTYFDNFKEGAKGHLPVHGADDSQYRFLQRNRTHFVHIVIPRCPKDRVFKLTQVPGSAAAPVV